jgi:Transcriptional regulator, AbiEi antitoxin, Type IV TA system/Transcriptional regulator, AbiEi antitoxin N-terminal domain
MAKQTQGKLNHLNRELPEELLVDASWLQEHGYSTSLRNQYVKAGWLNQPARRVYRRSRSELTWQQVVVSLQSILDYPLVVGGRTALELLGFAHYPSPNTSDVHLYGSKPPPNWLALLKVGVKFHYHSDGKLFREHSDKSHLQERNPSPTSERIDSINVGWNEEWRLKLSPPERAILEFLDELPEHESFEHADKIMEGLVNLSPKRLQEALTDCKSVKVKRLFFFFADRHKHAWLKRLDAKTFDLGKGKRMLVKGGTFDPRYQITVPSRLDAI